MNLDELKPEWQHYASATATRERKSLNELGELLPDQPPGWSQLLTGYSFLLKNVAMYAFIIIFCGGC